MTRKSSLPQKGQAVRNNFLVRKPARQSLSVPEGTNKRQNNVKKKKQKTEENVTIGNGSSEKLTAGSTGSSFSWIDYLPSDTYESTGDFKEGSSSGTHDSASGSEENSSSGSKRSSVSHNTAVEEQRSRATFFGEDFEDIIQTVDMHLDLDEASRNSEATLRNYELNSKSSNRNRYPNLRPLMSLDVSEITPAETKEYRKGISKFQQSATSTPIRRSESRTFSGDAGRRSSEATLTNCEPNSKLSYTNNYPNLRLLTSLDISDITPATTKEYPKVISKFQQPWTSTSSCRSESRTFSGDAEVIFSPEHIFLEIRLLPKIREPEEPPPPCEEDVSTQVLKTPHTSSAKKFQPLKTSAFKIEQFSKNYAHQASGDMQQVSRHEKQSNFLDKKPIKNKLMQDPVFTVAAEPRSQNYEEIHESPSIDEKSTLALILPDDSSLKSEIAETEQLSENYAFQDLEDIQQPSRYKIESFNIMDRKPIENTSDDSVFLTSVEQSFQREKLPGHKEIQKPQKNRKQKAIESSRPIENTVVGKWNLPKTEGSEEEAFPLQARIKSDQNVDNNHRGKHSAHIFSFPTDEEDQTILPYAETRRVLNSKPKEKLNHKISGNLNKKMKKERIYANVPICPLSDLLKRKPKPFENKRKPKYDYSNVPICPLEIWPGRDRARQIQMVSSKQKIFLIKGQRKSSVVEWKYNKKAKMLK